MTIFLLIQFSMYYATISLLILLERLTAFWKRWTAVSLRTWRPTATAFLVLKDVSMEIPAHRQPRTAGLWKLTDLATAKFTELPAWMAHFLKTSRKRQGHGQVFHGFPISTPRTISGPAGYSCARCTWYTYRITYTHTNTDTHTENIYIQLYTHTLYYYILYIHTLYYYILYIHTYIIHTYIHTCMHTYMHTYIHTRLCQRLKAVRFFCTLLLFFFRFGPIFVGKDAFFQKKGRRGVWGGRGLVTFFRFSPKKTFSHIISSIVLCATFLGSKKHISLRYQ